MRHIGYNIFVAFWAGHYAAEMIGCEVIPGGVLDTKARILKIQELKANDLMGTPTYILGMVETARLLASVEMLEINVSDLVELDYLLSRWEKEKDEGFELKEPQPVGS